MCSSTLNSGGKSLCDCPSSASQVLLSERRDLPTAAAIGLTAVLCRWPREDCTQWRCQGVSGQLTVGFMTQGIGQTKPPTVELCCNRQDGNKLTTSTGSHQLVPWSSSHSCSQHTTQSTTTRMSAYGFAIWWYSANTSPSVLQRTAPAARLFAVLCLWPHNSWDLELTAARVRGEQRNPQLLVTVWFICLMNTLLLATEVLSMPYLTFTVKKWNALFSIRTYVLIEYRKWTNCCNSC